MATPKKKQSGNPAKRSTAKTWKGKSQTAGRDLDLPSGNVALCQRLDPAEFLEAGFLPDGLSPIVAEAVRENKGLPPEKIDEMVGDPTKVSEMLQFMDKIVVRAVLDPRIHPKPVPDEDGDLPEHDEDLLYVNEVDLADKTFIMNWACGGSPDLVRFHHELASGVDALQPGEDVEEVSL